MTMSIWNMFLFTLVIITLFCTDSQRLLCRKKNWVKKWRMKGKKNFIDWLEEEEKEEEVKSTQTNYYFIKLSLSTAIDFRLHAKYDTNSFFNIITAISHRFCLFDFCLLINIFCFSPVPLVFVSFPLYPFCCCLMEHHHVYVGADY